MSERTRFFKSGVMLTLVSLAMRTVAMLFSAFISRNVGAEGVGLYTVIMTVYSFAVTFATSGISLTVTRLVASAIGEGRVERVGRVIRGAVLYSLAFGALSTLLLFFGADVIGRYILNDIRTVHSLKLLAFSLIPISLGSIISGYFVGVRRVGFNASAQVFSQFIKISVTVLLVIRFSSYGIERSVSALCLGITVTELIGFLIQSLEFGYDRIKHGKNVGARGTEISEIAKTALPLAFSAYVRSAFLTLEHILIPRRLRDGGESAKDAYSHYGLLHGMALPIVLYPMSPLSSFSGLLVPEFAADISRGGRARMNRIGSEAMNTTLTYSAICAVMLYFFAEELGYAVYGSYDAGKYITMLAPVVPIMYLDHVTDSMLKGIGEQVFSMWVNISDSILSILLVWFLIPRMGIGGYALVIIIMEVYNFALSYRRLKKHVKLSLTPIASLALPLSAGSAAACITDALFRFGGSASPVIWLVMKMVFCLALTVFFIFICTALFPNLFKKSNKKKESTPASV